MIEYDIHDDGSIHYDGMIVGYVHSPERGIFRNMWTGTDLSDQQHLRDTREEAAKCVVTEYRKPLTTVAIRDNVKLIDAAYSHDEDREQIDNWEKRLLARVLLGIAAGPDNAQQLAREALTVMTLKEKHR